MSLIRCNREGPSQFSMRRMAEELQSVDPSGETAFRNMTIPYGWAKRPMLEKIRHIGADIPLSFYGSRPRNSGYTIQKTRPSEDHLPRDSSSVIRVAGHYVFADQPDDFNQTILKILADMD